MRCDILALQAFHAGPLGRAAAAMAARRAADAWGDCAGLDLLAFGYATPILDVWRPQARRVVAFMPGAQGAEAWPAGGACATCLGEEERLPFPDQSFDRVVAFHLVEEAARPSAVLREIWRILAPEGRLMLVAAHRGGLWARLESSPLGQGRPWSRRQLAALLESALFQPEAWAKALYAPPLSWPAAAGAPEVWEQFGERLWPAFGGLILADAVKRLRVGPPPAASRRSVAVRPAPARPAPARPAWGRSAHDSEACRPPSAQK